MRFFKLIAVALLVGLAPAGLAVADMEGDVISLIDKAIAMVQGQEGMQNYSI